MLSYKNICILFATCWLVALVAVPVTAFSQNLDGLFSDNHKAFKISLKVIQCQRDDDMPKNLPGVSQDEKHQACGVFPAVELLDTTFSLLPGQKKKWQKTKPVPVSESVFKAVLEDDDTYQLERKTTSKKKLKAGYEMEVYLPEKTDNGARITLWFKHYALTNANEDMLLHAQGDVYLNPHARQIERMGVFNGHLEIGEENIWGGDSALRAPAMEDVPEIFPEEGRLWLEISLEK